MRHMEVYRKSAILSPEETSTLVYYVVVNDLKDFSKNLTYEMYGVGITIIETGETELVSDVTFSKTDILSLLKLLSDNLVTPVTVHDVVSDWLG